MPDTLIYIFIASMKHENEAYRKSMTTRAYQGYGNCERKTKVNNTHK